jgi:hypothetical protein
LHKAGYASAKNRLAVSTPGRMMSIRVCRSIDGTAFLKMQINFLRQFAIATNKCRYQLLVGSHLAHPNLTLNHDIKESRVN